MFINITGVYSIMRQLTSIAHMCKCMCDDRGMWVCGDKGTGYVVIRVRGGPMWVWVYLRAHVCGYVVY